MINLMLGDCLDRMSEIPDGSVDLVLTDPPYGTTACKWDAVIPFAPMWAHVWRVLKADGAAVFMASQPFSSALVMSAAKQFRHEWVWHKNKATGHLNAKIMPMKAHESVLVFSRSKPFYSPQMTDGHKPMNGYTQTSNGDCYGSTKRPSGGGSTRRYPRSVQEFPVVNNDDPGKTHATQKPVPLMEYLVRTYSRDTGVVLDFAMGSGTTGEACINSGRSFIGIERNEEFFRFAQHRLAGCAEQVPA